MEPEHPDHAVFVVVQRDEEPEVLGGLERMEQHDDIF